MKEDWGAVHCGGGAVHCGGAGCGEYPNSSRRVWLADAGKTSNLHCRDLLFTAELRWHVSAGWVQILFRSRATQFYSIEHFQFPGYMPKLIGKSDSIASLSLAVAYGKSRPAYTRWRVQSLPRKFFGRWWLDLSWSGGRSTQCQTYAMPLTCRCTTRAADSNDRHHMASSPVRYG